MTTATPPRAIFLREVVGTFADQAHFESAVNALVQSGFERHRLSVLASHESLDVANGEERSWRDGLVALVGELKYEGPLVAAGLIAIAAGPVGAAIAGLIAAGVGGAAIKEVLDEVSALPDSADFARALAAGSVILWVGVDSSQEEETATDLLRAAGGANVHLFERSGTFPA
ncbi:hypothetical protein [Magnetospirillum molischianum]|uniref:DUF1269 domain-containing protein n=1 Tax=Magnetospirillum molischianum DSM 120 TaxID=1150626 RepID=H8FQR8_MAGML|nr:hypothetical protein [Magnetospirillum molischianum]CCG40706.1 conserved hypothetical protein [Magnetospirillum molischianum DSM 120]